MDSYGKCCRAAGGQKISSAIGFKKQGYRIGFFAGGNDEGK